MLSPHEGRIQRQFQKGLWLQIRTSAHQRQIHAKINRIQIDNQVVNCLFPVILAPVPPPKSVLADSIPKPFIGNVKKLHILSYVHIYFFITRMTGKLKILFLDMCVNC